MSAERPALSFCLFLFPSIYFLKGLFSFPPFICSLVMQSHTSLHKLDFVFKFLLVFSCCFAIFLLVSSVQQSEAAVGIHVNPLFWISFPLRGSTEHRLDSSVLCSKVLVFILYIVSINVYFNTWCCLEWNNTFLSTHPPQTRTGRLSSNDEAKVQP